MMMEELRKQAKFLESRLDTDWAEENAQQYTDFEKAVNKAYDEGRISGKEFNELVLTAFYDYPEDLKEED